MNKIVSASEFKAKCLRLIEEMQADGIPITITKRGKVVAEVTPKAEAPRKSVIGILRSPEYKFDDPFSPAWDEPWDAEH